MIDIFNEENINLLENLNIPNTYWKNKTKEYQYWFRSLLHKIDSSIVFSNLPDGWSNDFFMLCLFAFGFVGVFETTRKDLIKYGKLNDSYGVLFQPCNISGRDFYYQPNEVTIANPMYDAVLKVGKEAEILKFTPDFKGIFDILDFYTSKLAELSKSIDMAITNTKYAFVLSATTQGQAELLKKIYDKVQAGESLVIYKELLNGEDDEVIPRKTPFEEWQNDFNKTFILDRLMQSLTDILDSFYMEIGLPVSPEKKERLITSEAEFSTSQSQARISCWYETIKESLEKINVHFGTNIEVTYASKNDVNRDRELSEQS